MKLKIFNSKITNNFNDKSMVEKFDELYHTKGLSVNLTTFILYDHYQSDYKGDYRVSIAQKNSKETDLIIPDTAQFKKFIVDSTDSQGISNTWKYIWLQEEKQLLNRNYHIDYEKHYPDGKIEIYIGVD